MVHHRVVHDKSAPGDGTDGGVNGLAGPLDVGQITGWLRIFIEPGQVAELRILNTPRSGTVSGYFNDLDKMARAATSWSGKAPAVYFTLNPVNPPLLARATNRLVERARSTTSDSDILRRRWLFFDFDPRRPAGISSTNAEHLAALKRAEQCRDWLCSLGWPSPVEADSSNGAHLLYLIDLPNDPEASDLIRRCLQAVAFQFTDEAVEVDCTTYNAARICKLYGTLSCKGDSTSDRPHRLSRVLSGPDPLVKVPRDLLEALAGRVPPEPAHPLRNGYAGNFDVEQWIRDHNLTVVGSGPWEGSGRKWVLSPCPWNEEHNDRAAYIVRLSNGAIAAGCHHNGCQGNDWYALRDLCEPGWRERRDQGPGRTKAETGVGGLSPPGEPEGQAPAWPGPLDAAAYHGLAGEIIRSIQPHSEADPVALLVQLLTAFGNKIGRTAHWRIEGTTHYLNLFVVLVGRTSKARKGTSLGRIRQVMEQVEPFWAVDRVKGGLASGEGMVHEIRDPIMGRQPIKGKGGRIEAYQDVELDEGVADKRLLCVEEEYAGVLRMLERQGNSLSQRMREAWQGNPLGSMTKNSKTRCREPHVSLIGHITGDELRRYLTTTEMGNGFGNRHLWCCVQRSKLLPRGSYYVPSVEQIQSLQEAANFAVNAGELDFNHEAGALWEAVYGDLSEGRPGLSGCMLGRAEAQVLRLACLYAVLDLSFLIRPEHLGAALALWRYCEQSVYYLFGDSLGDPVADEILRALRQSPKGLTREQIRDLFGRHRSAADIGRALGLLLEHGLARMTKEDTGGRPAERWFALSRGARKAT